MTALTAARLAALIPRGQEAAEQSMSATCEIRRIDQTGSLVKDETTGQFVKPTLIVYEGVCEFKFTSTVLSEIDAQGQSLTEQRPLLKLPLLSSAEVQVDDIGRILTSRFNPSQVGLKFRVAGGHDQNHVTARRLPTEILN